MGGGERTELAKRERTALYSDLGRGASEPSSLISGFGAPGKDARIFLFDTFAVAERSMALVVSPPGLISSFIYCHDLKNEFSWGPTPPKDLGTVNSY